ncbi:MAG TPA: ABC transporter substrate-binding protein [Dehalococcoidia bacterium]|nr:ABC transporter substrate-binding protein [Dehalococcoidia bacterium]
MGGSQNDLSRVCRRLYRRQFLAAAVGAGVASASLDGCGVSRSPSSTANGGSAGPRTGGTLNISFNFTRGFDPHILQASDTSLHGMFYSTLVRANPKTYDVEPDLAAKWETPSQTEMVFTLAPNIRWQDKPPVSGRPLKVDDVIYSYQRLQTNDPKFVNKSYLAGIDKMESVDAKTLKLTLKRPDVTQLGSLTQSSMEILAPEVVDAARGNLATADFAVGTGAFVLQRSEPNVASSLVRNPTYFKPGRPYLDRVEVRAFTDVQAEWSAFLAGQIDSRWVAGQDSQKFAGGQKSEYGLQWFGDLGYMIMQAMTKKKPWDDARVTRAMRLLIDHAEAKSAWAEVWFGRGRYSECFAAGTADTWDLSDDDYGRQLEWKQPKDDAVKEALALLSAAGFTKANPLRFTLSGLNSDYQQAAPQLAQAQFKRLSQGVVNPELRVYESATWTKVREAGDFEYLISGHTSGGSDPDTYFSSTHQTGGGRNYGKMSDLQLDQMIARQRTIFDGQERKKAVRDIVLYMIDHSPYGVFIDRYILSATQAKVHQFPAEGPTNKFGSYYEDIWLA